jgi:hypothetical protein
MQSIKLRSHVGSDGILQLQVPIGLQDVDLEVMVIVHPITAGVEAIAPEQQGWQVGFFEDVIGSWEGEPLVRPEQGQFEVREELL